MSIEQSYPDGGTNEHLILTPAQREALRYYAQGFRPRDISTILEESRGVSTILGEDVEEPPNVRAVRQRLHMARVRNGLPTIASLAVNYVLLEYDPQSRPVAAERFERLNPDQQVIGHHMAEGGTVRTFADQSGIDVRVVRQAVVGGLETMGVPPLQRSPVLFGVMAALARANEEGSDTSIALPLIEINEDYRGHQG